MTKLLLCLLILLLTSGCVGSYEGYTAREAFDDLYDCRVDYDDISESTRKLANAYLQVQSDYDDLVACVDDYKSGYSSLDDCY